MFGLQIIGRFLLYYQQNVNVCSLIQQCDSDGLEYCVFVFLYYCFYMFGGLLQYLLEGYFFVFFGIGMIFNGKYLVLVLNKFIIWDLVISDVFR